VALRPNWPFGPQAAKAGDNPHPHRAQLAGQFWLAGGEWSGKGVLASTPMRRGTGSGALEVETLTGGVGRQ
jgi:hypothetical protein